MPQEYAPKDLRFSIENVAPVKGENWTVEMRFRGSKVAANPAKSSHFTDALFFREAVLISPFSSAGTVHFKLFNARLVASAVFDLQRMAESNMAKVVERKLQLQWSESSMGPGPLLMFRIELIPAPPDVAASVWNPLPMDEFQENSEQLLFAPSANKHLEAKPVASLWGGMVDESMIGAPPPLRKRTSGNPGGTVCRDDSYKLYEPTSGGDGGYEEDTHFGAGRVPKLERRGNSGGTNVWSEIEEDPCRPAKTTDNMAVKHSPYSSSNSGESGRRSRYEQCECGGSLSHTSSRGTLGPHVCAHHHHHHVGRNPSERTLENRHSSSTSHSHPHTLDSSCSAGRRRAAAECVHEGPRESSQHKTRHQPHPRQPPSPLCSNCSHHSGERERSRPHSFQQEQVIPVGENALAAHPHSRLDQRRGSHKPAEERRGSRNESCGFKKVVVSPPGTSGHHYEQELKTSEKDSNRLADNDPRLPQNVVQAVANRHHYH